MQKEPFTIAVSDATLADLRERLLKTRWPRDFANAQWQYGTNLEYLKELVDYWIHHYDWRKQEREINAFSHYKTTIEGMPIHFIHEPGKGPKPIAADSESWLAMDVLGPHIRSFVHCPTQRHLGAIRMMRLMSSSPPFLAMDSRRPSNDSRD